VSGIRSGRYVSIGKADVRKSMLWARDIATILPSLSKEGGTYNLTDGYHPTFGELERSISQLLNKKSPLSIPLWLAKGLGILGDIFGDRIPINSEKISKITSSLTFDDSKARRVFGWRPHRVLDKIQCLLK